MRGSAVAIGLGVVALAACASPDRVRLEPRVTVVLVDSVTHADSARVRSVLIPFAIPDEFETGDSSALSPVQRILSRPDTLPISPVDDTLAFPLRAAGELAKLDPSSTPVRWTRSHPGDRLARYVRGAEPWRRWDEEPLYGRWCVRARRKIPVPDRAVVRSAYFYPPPMPSPALLPPVRDSPGVDLTGCRLGAIWVEDEGRGYIEGRRVAGETRRELSRDRGEPHPVERFGTYRAEKWLEVGFWRDGHATALSFYDAQTYQYGLRAGAWRAFSGIELGPYSSEEIAREAGMHELRETIALAGLDTAEAEPLLSAGQLAYASRLSLPLEAGPEAGISDSTFVSMLETWIEQAGDLPTARRAAVLLVADWALSRSTVAIDDAHPKGNENRAALEAVGATFGRVYDYAYTRGWLWEAYRLARGGPIGDHAFLALLRSGFDTSVACGGGVERFRTVIEEGERFLRERSTAEPRMRARVHLEVARAWSDIVAIASETTSPAREYLEAERYREEAAAARRNAVEHYQAALDVLAATGEGETIWREGWRVAAGLPPLVTRHVCIWD